MIVECEDALHVSFARRFFDRVGVPAGKKPDINPREGKDGVLDVMVEGVQTARKHTPETHLVVLIDGDNWDGTKVRMEIDKRLVAAGDEPLRPGDRVLIIVPRWQMDTWVRHLRGEVVTEDQNGAAKLGTDREARGPAQLLAEHCRNHRPLPNPLPSLEAACREWQAYRERHGL